MKLFIAILLLSSFSALAQTTRTVCSSGCDHTTVQASIDAASRGDTIVITAGQTFTEDVILKYKASGSGYVTIQSSALASLPTAGNRVAPADASNMPTIRSTAAGSASAISTESGANPTGYYKLIGLNILRHNSTSQQTAVISLGTSGSTQDTIDETPHNIIIDRCLIRGADNASTRRGIALNSKNTQIINSYIDNFWETGSDSQGILGWNGTQDITIANNFIEAASENVLFGAVDPSITNFVPNNILIEHNHFFKRLSWLGASPAKVVKNLFELKSARLVTIQNNIFENNWLEAQNGFAILFTVRNQDGGAAWSTIEDVTFQYNIVKNTASGLSILATDDINTSDVVSNLNHNNNLFITAQSTLAGQGWNILIQGSNAQGYADNITFDHNTFISQEHGEYENQLIEFIGTTDLLTNFSVTDNLAAGAEGANGFIGFVRSSTNNGSAALAQASNGGTYTFAGNLLQRASTTMPSGNWYETTLSGIGFEDYAGGDYSLDAASNYKNDATDGTDPGVNWSQLQSRTANVVAGTGWSQSGTSLLPVKISSGIRLRGVRL